MNHVRKVTGPYNIDSSWAGREKYAGRQELKFATEKSRIIAMLMTHFPTLSLSWLFVIAVLVLVIPLAGAP